MREGGIRSKIAKKFKATTNSKHDLPVAENLLNREFTASKPSEKMVSDISRQMNIIQKSNQRHRGYEIKLFCDN